MAVIAAPDYVAATEAFVSEAVHQIMVASDSIYAGLRRRSLPEGVSTVAVMTEGAVVTSPEVNLQEGATVNRADVLTGNLDALHAVVEKLAQSYLRQFIPTMLAYVGEAAESVGNTMDLSGADLSWPILLDALEKVEWQPDEVGKVQQPQIVAGPETIQRIRDLGEMPADQQARLAAIKARKQEEHVSRRRSRRLR